MSEKELRRGMKLKGVGLRRKRNIKELKKRRELVEDVS